MNNSARPTVAVIGLGAIGSMAAWQLAVRGVSVVGFDAFAPGHDRGASGGESRIFRIAYKEGEQYVPLLMRARQLWLRLEREGGRRLFHTTGCATLGPDAHPQMEAVRSAAVAHGLPLQSLDRQAAAELVPEHPLRAGETLLLDPQGGLLHPELGVLTAVELAEARGAEIRRYTPVHDVIDDGLGGARVLVDGSVEHFDGAVVALGPWAANFPSLAPLPLHLRRIVATWFPRRPDSPFALDHSPVAIRVGDPAYSCFPPLDELGVKVIRHGGFPVVPDLASASGAATASEAQAASEAVRATLPSLVPHPTRTGAFCDAYTPDGHAIVGLQRPDSALVVAAGFSGHGFKLAPAFGELAAALALDHEHAAPPFLRPTRFARPD